MCGRPDFEAMQRYMDETLISLFREWYDFLDNWLEEDELQKIDRLEEFCNAMRGRLIALKDTPKVQEVIGRKL